MENNKYQNGKIYRITDLDYNKFYYGSTTEQLLQRMARHRACYKRYKDGKYPLKSAFSIFDEYGFDNCKIALVEKYPCSDREELVRRESYLIQSNTCANRRLERTKKEYLEEHRDKISQYKKDWAEANNERVKECKSVWYMKNKHEIFRK